MTALPNYPNVHAIRARRVKITPGNSIFAPLAKDPARQLELAEAERIIAPTATQAGMVENAETPAYSWPARDGYFRKADALPAIKTQAEIDDEIRVFSPAAYAVMFAAVGLMGLIWGIGEPLMWGLIRIVDWLMGVV